MDPWKYSITFIGAGVAVKSGDVFRSQTVPSMHAEVFITFTTSKKLISG